MGNEMGNNNVIGQQASEETKNFDKTMADSDCSPGHDNINDKEKVDTKDDMSEVLKAPLISNGGDDKMTSDKPVISATIEDLDGKNRGSLQDHSSAQDDHANINLHTKEGDETQEDSETEIITNSTEKVGPVGITIEDMTRNKDTSSYDEQFKQLVHVSAEESEESTLAKPPTLFEENTESLPKDEEEFRSQEVAVVGGNPVSEAAVENLEGQTRVSAVSDLSTPTSVQGETASSTESILTDYCDTDIKDVVVEDEPRERGNPSYVRPEDDTNQETYKSEEEREICEMGKSKSCKTIATDTVNGSYQEVLEEDKKIHWLENQEEELPKCSAYGALDTGEAVSLFQSALAVSSATDGREFQKHELGIAATREISDSVIAEVDPNVIEMTDKDQGETIDKDVADKNEADSFEGDKTPDGTHDVVSIIKVNGKDSGLGQSLSAPLPILNEVIIEELSAPMTATSFALQPVEASIKEDIKPSSLDSNEGTTTSTYEAKTIDTHVTMNNSQCDQPQQVLLEEPEVVKFENSKTLTTCMQLVEYNSATEISPNVFHKEREDTSHKATRFTSESNQDNLTGTVGFASESTQKKVITDGDKASEEQCLLQTPTLGRDVAHAGEETPLLLSAESINSSSYSSEEHIEVVKVSRTPP